MHTHHDAIVIGGGPAGCSAAAVLARFGWATVILDRSMAGSHLASLGAVPCFPGFPDAITGQEILRRMRRQAELAGAAIVSETVNVVRSEEGRFKVLTESGKEFEARAVVVATGAGLRSSYAPGERELAGRGVFLDVHLDGPAVAKKVAAVVGKSRQAAEEALALARFAERVHLVIPSSKLEADEALIEELQKHRAIELHYSTSLKKVNGDDHVTSITVLSGGQEKEIPLGGVFTYGHEHKATSAFLAGSPALSQGGTVKVDRGLATEVSGLFAAGDILCARPQLPVLAASQGVLAGLSADQHLAAAEPAPSGGPHAV